MPRMSQRIAVFGMGYVGCVSAACLASRGNQVVGVDVSPDKVAMVSEGRTPVVEERIGDLIAEQVREGRLRATTDAAEAIAATDIALVCVGTPSTPAGDLTTTYLEQVADEIGTALRDRDGPLHRRAPLDDAADDLRRRSSSRASRPPPARPPGRASAWR